MAYREVSRVEIAEVVRRWQSGMSQRQIATGTGLSRATVRRYIDAAVEAGLARDGPAPSEEQLTRLAGAECCGPPEGGDTDRGGPRPLGGPGLRVADGRSVAGDPHPWSCLRARGCRGLVRVCWGGSSVRRGWQRRSRHDGADGERAHQARWRRWTSAVWV